MSEPALAGGEKLRAALRLAGAAGPRILGGAPYREAETIMSASKKLVPVDMGVLRASGFVRAPAATAAGVEVVLGYGGAAHGYALYVHEGTGPAVGRPAFMPPPSAVLPWMRRHGIPERAAWAVARAIGRRGLRQVLGAPRAGGGARDGRPARAGGGSWGGACCSMTSLT